MILIVNAGGAIASRVARLLADAHVPIRELDAAELDRPGTLAASLRDVEQLFLAAPGAEREMWLIDKAARAGVERVLKVGSTRDDVAALKDSGLEWTLVVPSPTIETVVLPQLDAARREGVLWGAAGDARVALIAADDVARAATLVLAERDYDGAELEVTGPEALSLPQIAERFGAALGVEVAYRDVPEGDLADRLRDTGLPADRIEREILPQFAAIRAGRAERVTGEVERLTGVPPASLDAFLGSYATA